MASAWDKGIVADAAVAQSVAQAHAFWAMRDDIDGLVAAMRPAFLYDISLPQAHMAAYVDQLENALRQRWPQARLVVFGHIADGNLHLFICTGRPEDHDEADRIVYAPLKALGGSISAEHGIGIEKMRFLGISRTPAEIELMRALKRALDPRQTLNPGKIFADERLATAMG